MRIQAKDIHFSKLSEQIRETSDLEITIEECMGQRYIGTGLSKKTIDIYGIPGNGLGAYLDGGEINVYGNAQDATGDTMNEGSIMIHGSSGDATGYAMRGGKIFVKENAGYRAGIHMKAYEEKVPILIIGGRAGSFLGEYQAGGIIIILGLNIEGIPVGNFCGMGMHGGKIYLRGNRLPGDLPPQIVAREANDKDLEEIKAYIEEFCDKFKVEVQKVLEEKFFILEPDSKNPYKQLYTHN